MHHFQLKKTVNRRNIKMGRALFPFLYYNDCTVFFLIGNFDVLLTVNLSIILANDQLNAQILVS